MNSRNILILFKHYFFQVYLIPSWLYLWISIRTRRARSVFQATLEEWKGARDFSISGQVTVLRIR